MRASVLSTVLPSPLTKPRLGHNRQGRPSGLSKSGVSAGLLWQSRGGSWLARYVMWLAQACHALNPWKTLEVEEGASHKEIKRAYRKLALRSGFLAN